MGISSPLKHNVLLDLILKLTLDIISSELGLTLSVSLKEVGSYRTPLHGCMTLTIQYIYICTIPAWPIWLEDKSFCEVPKYVINTRLMKFTCYTHVQSCNIESCIATIAIQLPKVD